MCVCVHTYVYRFITVMSRIQKNYKLDVVKSLNIVRQAKPLCLLPHTLFA